MSKKKIVALDMATKLGWATNCPEVSGTENFKKKAGDSRGMIFIRFESWLSEILEKVKPELVVYERPHARGRAANEILNGMLAFMAKCCEQAGCEYTDCPSTTLKKHATGKGNAGKDAMMQAYLEKWGHRPQDDNESDARWLLDWAEGQF